MKDLKIVNTMYGEFKTTTIPKKYENRKPWSPKNEKEIKSFIPGTVTALFVSIGDVVKKGDLLYGFKAMKMENKVQSDIDGEIKTINFLVGESFSKGVVIIEYK